MQGRKSGSSIISPNLIGVLVVMVGVIIAFFVFYHSNVTRIRTQNENYIEDIAAQRAALMNSLFEENISYIESSAIVLETDFQNTGVNLDLLNVDNDSDLDPNEVNKVAQVLRTYEERFAFDHLRFIDLKGRDYTTGEKVIAAVVNEREYYKKGIRGETGMTYILDSKVTSERQIGFYSPVYLSGKLEGIAVGFYGEKFMHELLDISLFGHECDMLLCDREGTVIYRTGRGEDVSNFLDSLETLSFPDKGDLDNIRNAFENRNDARYSYEIDGVRTVGHVSYVGERSDFFLVLNFPVDTYQEMIRNSSINGATLLINLIALFLMAGFYYVIRSILQRKKIMEEAKNSNDIHFAMSRLFENFVIVDATKGTYDYIEGMPDVGHIPNVGPYDLFVSDLLERFPDEEERKQAQELISFEHLIQEMNRGTDIISCNLHAPIREEEWFTYNFIVVSRDKEGKVSEFLIARQDITKLQEKEEEIRRILERARDEAEKGNKAKSNFLSSMSHDIRTPMNAIIGYTNIAIDRIDDKEMVRDSLDKISTSSHYLLSLINDVLDMSKIESGKVQIKEDECDLRVIIDRIADLTETQASKKNLSITFDMEELKHPYVLADELRLEQVLINITGNAVKYTPEGGSISVKAAEEPLLSEDKSRYVFTVKDTGIGMSEEFLPQIFDSFSRETTSTINRIQGTGLGMAITSSLVGLMNGTISVKSKLGEGSEFIVTVDFPILKKAEASHENAGEDGGQIDLNGRRILIVEDNDINAEIAILVLSSYGIVTERAVNGKEGVIVVQDRGDSYFDAVLMDIQMPVMNGYEATREIRSLEGEYFKRLPIIAMSANAYEEDIRQAIESGMNGHIAKPFDPEDLAKELQMQILNAETVSSM